MLCYDKFYDGLMMNIMQNFSMYLGLTYHEFDIEFFEYVSINL